MIWPNDVHECAIFEIYSAVSVTKIRLKYWFDSIAIKKLHDKWNFCTLNFTVVGIIFVYRTLKYVEIKWVHIESMFYIKSLHTHIGSVHFWIHFALYKVLHCGKEEDYGCNNQAYPRHSCKLCYKPIVVLSVWSDMILFVMVADVH